MGKKRERIENPFLILCEGRDEKMFLVWYLDSMKKADDRFEKVHVIDFGGNTELYDYLQVLQNTEGYEIVRNMLVIRDAEVSASAAVQQICSAFQRAGFHVGNTPGIWNENGPICIAFLLLPVLSPNPSEGTLEDLCLSILKEDNQPLLDDVQNFLELVKAKHGRKLNHEFKSKVHTYFSITDAYVAMKIGEAAQAGAFDWNSENMDGLRRLILGAEG